MNETVLKFLERHIQFIKTTMCFLFIYCGILLYTFDRSFRVHQDTLSRVLRWNNREGVFCSQVHVGHDGTTLWFQTIPKEVGTAGPIDPSILSCPHELQTLSMDPYLFALIPLALFLLILFIWILRSKKDK